MFEKTTTPRLQNAPKRDSITLRSVAIRVEYKGAVIYCSDRRELDDVLDAIDSRSQGLGSFKTRWDSKAFWNFVGMLGRTQKIILRLLLEDDCSDVELRNEVGVKSNQQLAGLLSGISKQAAAQGMPARAVYKIESESTGGEVAKTYVIAPEFAHVAAQNNWTGE